MEKNRSAVSEGITFLPVVCHKSTATFQTNSNKVLNSTLRSQLGNCVKIEVIGSTGPPQLAHKWGTIVLGT